ncbi:hypothetical protein Mgra_00007922 [Meloidogyne graminicola]|uniref:Uncharacterized protein n=1 Tax=Meloidogyne graminicola TaxID=189291 RepID=A0A8S9ZHC6_9BILA|nr:hypothetical protein Mgra_00007922 [Meloidogyne graminicola]
MPKFLFIILIYIYFFIVNSICTSPKDNKSESSSTPKISTPLEEKPLSPLLTPITPGWSLNTPEEIYTPRGSLRPHSSTPHNYTPNVGPSHTPGVGPSHTPGVGPSHTPGAGPSHTPGVGPSHTPDVGPSHTSHLPETPGKGINSTPVQKVYGRSDSIPKEEMDFYSLIGKNKGKL